MSEYTKTWLVILIAIIGIPTIIFLDQGFGLVGLLCIILIDAINNYNPDKRKSLYTALSPINKTWLQNVSFFAAIAWVIAIIVKAPNVILMPLCFINILSLLYDGYKSIRRKHQSHSNVY